jgi:hypothetical protein
MNRGTFLKTLGLSAGAIAFSPLLSFAQKDRVKIYKINTPVFQLTYTDGQKDIFGSLIKHAEIHTVSQRYGTLEERLKYYKDREEDISVILYCEEEEILPTLINRTETGEWISELRVWPYSRASIYKNIQVIDVINSTVQAYFDSLDNQKNNIK